jgi:hypothetical protein
MVKSRQGTMQGQVRDGRFDSLCSALDCIQGRAGLIELAEGLCLQRVVGGESAVEVWKGKALGAGIEILLLAPADASSAWAISTLVTVGGRVEHLTRRPFWI